jgi:peptidoglycan/LPS O-acetylase OafA/YrhL
MRGLAILMIVFYHITIAIYGTPWFAHPRSDWPERMARIAQLRPIPQENTAAFLLANLFRYAGWLGYQGTGVFLMISGFGLTWALVSRSPAALLDRRAFYLRRFLRLFPLYWAGHLFFLVFNNLAGWRPFSPLDPRFALSLLGLRFLPGVFHFISPAWWFIALIMQLYAVFPFLWEALKRWGAVRFGLGALALTLLSRAIGFFLLPVDPEMWSRGLLFTSRLGEFALGMILAWWAAGDPARVHGWLRSPRSGLALLFLYGCGLGLSFTRPGAVIAPLLITPAASGFLVVFARDLLPRWPPAAWVLSRVGTFSYGVMVFHQPLLWALIVWLWPFQMPLSIRMSLIGAATVFIVIFSAVMETGVNRLLGLWPFNRIFPPLGPYARMPA